MAKKTYLLGFILICALLAFSVYLEFYRGVIPCALCTLQRLTFVALGGIFLFGFIFYSFKRARRIIHCLSMIVSLLGVGLAGRQIWLQHLPPTLGDECGVGLQYMLKVLPWHEAFTKIFTGTTECSQRGWEFLNLDMAEWSLLCFLFFFFCSGYLWLKQR